MTLDYSCLGKNEEVRERRYKVFILTLKGAKPVEIQKTTGQAIRQVYNDLLFLRTNPLHNLSVDMMRDLDQSWFAIKISELERNLQQLDPYTNMWLKTQELLLRYKVDLMKLSGVLVERVEHSGSVELNTVQIYLPENNRDDKSD